MTIFVLNFTLIVFGEDLKSEFNEIKTEELKQLMNDKKKFFLLDARTKEEYEEAHIIQAENIPINKWNSYKKNLPRKKRTLIITYCNGVQCGKSIKAANMLKEMGYKKIKIYREGFPVWEEFGFELVKGSDYGKKIETNKITSDELKSLIDKESKDIIIVDVRDEKEFSEGHIPSSINIPVEDFAKRSDEVSKKKKVIVYCNSGSRSYLAYKKLVNMAYKDIHQALYSEWKNSLSE